MAKPNGTKNSMRTPEEKAKIIEEYLNGNEGYIIMNENMIFTIKYYIDGITNI